MNLYPQLLTPHHRVLNTAFTIQVVTLSKHLQRETENPFHLEAIIAKFHLTRGLISGVIYLIEVEEKLI